MNKDEYLDLLNLYLQDLPPDEIKDILSDYEEHFHIGISKGKSEEEISKELGSPKAIAANYQGSTTDNYSDNRPNVNSNDGSRRLLIGFLLIFFNLVIVLGPFMAVIGMLISSYITSFSMVIGGVAFIFGPIIPFTSTPNFHIITSLSFGIGFIGLGILGSIFSIFITKHLYRLVVRYLNWNLELINK